MSGTVLEKNPPIEELDSIVIRFAGDSGDGMQLTGTQFTNTSAVFGNDISTLPDFPGRNSRPPLEPYPVSAAFRSNFPAKIF